VKLRKTQEGRTVRKGKNDPKGPGEGKRREKSYRTLQGHRKSWGILMKEILRAE